MIEYLLDAIRATAGTDNVVTARVTQDDDTPITDGCEFVIHDGNRHLSFDGVCQDGIWSFEIPAEATKDFKGRYMYCIKRYDEQLCFQQPIYFV